MGQAGRERVAREFSPAAIVPQLESYYLAALAPRA